MELYFAPMEGITGYVYRNAHRAFFPQITKYFTPFLSPTQHKCFSARERRDILPEHNEGLRLVPQLLTNRAELFIQAARELSESYGYQEINLNLGCPSATVTTKGKGAGFLARPEELDAFLYRIFEAASAQISVKTRIGDNDPQEWYALLDIFNKYPLKELIIHPRVRTDFYKNKPNLKAFGDALATSKNSVCYNGDIFTQESYDALRREFPTVEKVMLGRGLLTNPALPDGEAGGAPLEKQRLRAFHDRIYEGYLEAFDGDLNVLFKMKELWFYMGQMFTDYEKYVKAIKKAVRFEAYEAAVNRLFEEQQITVAH